MQVIQQEELIPGYHDTFHYFKGMLWIHHHHRLHICQRDKGDAAFLLSDCQPCLELPIFCLKGGNTWIETVPVLLSTLHMM